ncbi:MAG: hypothetical protein FWD61_08890 [Phycisphaerales bacterium]|nr:hypothetical protein [Phycisphaerales bacterium]
MLVGYLQIMLLGDAGGVPDPLAYHVYREKLAKLGLSTAPQIRKQLRPRIESGPLDDPFQVRPQIGILLSVASDDVFRPRLGGFVNIPQVRQQFRKDRHPPFPATDKVFRLWRVNQKPATFPINIPPPQPQMLRRTAKASVSAQSEQQFPLDIRAGVEHFLSHVLCHKKHASRVHLSPGSHVGKGTLRNQFPPNRQAEQVLGHTDPPTDRRFGQSAFLQILPPLVRVRRFDGS